MYNYCSTEETNVVAKTPKYLSPPKTEKHSGKQIKKANSSGIATSFKWRMRARVKHVRAREGV